MSDATPTSKARTAPRDGEPLAAVLGRGDLLTSLFAIFPLFLIYEIGVAFTPTMNGVDFISRNLFAVVGHSRQNYLIVNGVLALIFIIVLLYKRRTRKLKLRSVLPMFLESGIYALTLGTLIVFIMRKFLQIEPSLAVGGHQSASASIILSCGAGFHEELIFRLGVCAGGAALLRLIGTKHWLAVTIAFLVSSALFSAAHHLGAAGDPWSFNLFVYRTIAGMLFASIFYYRSLAHAAYTHAFYDIYVMLFH